VELGDEAVKGNIIITAQHDREDLKLQQVGVEPTSLNWRPMRVGAMDGLATEFA